MGTREPRRQPDDVSNARFFAVQGRTAAVGQREIDCDFTEWAQTSCLLSSWIAPWDGWGQGATRLSCDRRSPDDANGFAQRPDSILALHTPAARGRDDCGPRRNRVQPKAARNLRSDITVVEPLRRQKAADDASARDCAWVP